MLIPGYHYSNELTLNPLKNNICILRDDGSKLILQNAEENKPYGLFIEQGSNNYGFAKVEMIGTTNCRRIYYKPGDGLTYVFEEENGHFLDSLYNLSNLDLYPRIIYLKEIRSTSDRGTVIYFDYTNTLNDTYLAYGRKALVGIHSSTRPYLHTYFGISDAYLTNLTIYNYTNNDKLTLTLSGCPNLSYTGRNTDYSRIFNVTGIKDNLNRQDNITYYPTGTATGTDIAWREYTYMNKFFFDYFPKLVNEINYHNKKFTDFSYYGRYFDAENHSPDCLNFAITDPQHLYSGMISNSKLTFRDCFTNYMIKSQAVYDTSKYGKVAPGPDDPKLPEEKNLEIG